MSIPTSQPIPPEDEEQPAPAHHRRQRRPPNLELVEGSGSLRTLVHLNTPSFDYYLGFILAGLIAAAAMLLDAPAFYLLAVLFAPFLGPVFGLSLAAATGSGVFFLRSLFHLVAGGGLVFALGALAGWIGSNLPSGRSFDLVHLYTRLAWPDFFVVAVGSGLTAYLLARSPRQKPLVANIAVAYGLILPLAASGFALTAGINPDWNGALTVFLCRLALAVLVSAVVFTLLGYKPVSLFGYVLSVIYLLAGVAAILFAAGSSPTPQVPAEPLPVAPPTATSTATAAPTMTESLRPEGKVTPSIQPTSTPTGTLIPTIQPTATMTIAPTPVWAKIDAPSGGGAFIRAEPGGKILTSLLNGSPVEVISEPLRVEGGAIWVKVRTENGVEGWILQSLLATATPSPGW